MAVTSHIRFYFLAIRDAVDQEGAALYKFMFDCIEN